MVKPKQQTPAVPAAKVRQVLAFAPITVTRSKRPHPVDPWQPLASSKTGERDLTKNPPTVLPRGVTNLLLDAQTTPRDQPVLWEVALNDNALTTTLPRIDPVEGGRKAVLKTDQPGSFSVLVRVRPDDPPIVWNVVFVAVTLTIPAPIRANPGSAYFGDPFLDMNVMVATGTTTRGQFAWEGELQATLAGGGASKTLGVDKIRLHMLQNGTGDSIVANYVDTNFAVVQMEEHLPEIPVVDTDDIKGVVNPTKHFAEGKNAVLITPDNVGAARHVVFLDSPRTLPFRLHPEDAPSFRLATTDGTMDFLTGLAATSTDAPHSIAVYATARWKLSVSGAVEHRPNPSQPSIIEGHWTPAGDAGPTFDPAFTLHPGGMDAHSAGFEVWPPNFLNQVQLRRRPRP
jgi:hypothetical protein